MVGTSVASANVTLAMNEDAEDSIANFSSAQTTEEPEEPASMNNLTTASGASAGCSTDPMAAFDGLTFDQCKDKRASGGFARACFNKGHCVVAGPPSCPPSWIKSNGFKCCWAPYNDWTCDTSPNMMGISSVASA